MLKTSETKGKDRDEKTGKGKGPFRGTAPVRWAQVDRRVEKCVAKVTKVLWKG